MVLLKKQVVYLYNPEPEGLSFRNMIRSVIRCVTTNVGLKRAYKYLGIPFCTLLRVQYSTDSTYFAYHTRVRKWHLKGVCPLTFWKSIADSLTATVCFVLTSHCNPTLNVFLPQAISLSVTDLITGVHGRATRMETSQENLCPLTSPAHLLHQVLTRLCQSWVVLFLCAVFVC